jgi:hypothetical protein
MLLAPATASASNERVNYRAADNSPDDTFFAKGGLELTGSCDSGNLSVIASTTVGDALIHYNAQAGSPTAAFDNDFETTESHDIVGDLDAQDSAIGQIVFAKPGGVNVTIDWLSEEEGPFFGSDKNCVFTGHARKAPNDMEGRVNLRTNAGVGQDNIFFQRSGLQLVQAGAASCAASGTTEVSARSTVANAMIGDYGQYTNDPDTVDSDATDHDPNFDIGIGDEMFLSDAGSMDQNSSGHLVYARSGGTNVTVDYAAEEGPPVLFGDKNCVFVGSTRVAESGSSNRVNFRPTGDAPLAKFFQLGGLKLRAQCSSSEMTVTAKTAHDDAMIHWGYQFPNNGDNGNENDIFATTDEEEIYGAGSLDGSLGGQIVYSRPGGVNVTVDFMAEENDLPFDGDRPCAFVGTAEKNAP